MTRLFVNLQENSYPIFIRRSYDLLCQCLDELGSVSKIIIISDINVDYYQSEELILVLKSQGYDIYKYVFEAGDKSKNLDTVESIYRFLVTHSVERNDVIIAFGGGVVGDIAGFVAATYLRGIKFVQVPTTLLAQVDSSVGGKVGVNFNKLKNIVGAFYQPKFVYINTNSMKTLPIREIRSGMAEVIVHCIIGDSCLFEYIETHIASIFQHDNAVLEHVISKSCSIKISVVEQDEKDQGIRAILNFGHTIGHAIESIYDFKISHGECVAVGIVGAFKIARYMGFTDDKAVNRVINILKKIGLPYFLEGLDVDRVFSQMFFDKKVLNNTLKFILPKGIGEVIQQPIEDRDLVRMVLKELSKDPVKLEEFE